MIQKSKLFLDTKTLNRWKSVQGLFLMAGNQAQVICRCYGTTQHLWLARPAQISELDGVILLTFALNQHIREAQIKKKLSVDPYIWKAAKYVRRLSACIMEFEPEELTLVDTLPNIRYLNFDERSELEAKISAAENERAKRAV